MLCLFLEAEIRLCIRSQSRLGFCQADLNRRVGWVLEAFLIGMKLLSSGILFYCLFLKGWLLGNEGLQGKLINILTLRSFQDFQYYLEILVCTIEQLKQVYKESTVLSYSASFPFHVRTWFSYFFGFVPMNMHLSKTFKFYDSPHLLHTLIYQDFLLLPHLPLLLPFSTMA